MADKKENLNRKKISGAIAEDRPQPHNLEAEKAVIAAMLREPHPCVDIAIELLHNEEVFYSHIHREIFKTVTEIYNNTEMSVDLISIAHQLAKTANSKISGAKFSWPSSTVRFRPPSTSKPGAALCMNFRSCGT